MIAPPGLDRAGVEDRRRVDQAGRDIRDVRPGQDRIFRMAPHDRPRSQGFRMLTVTQHSGFFERGMMSPLIGWPSTVTDAIPASTPSGLATSK